MVVFYRKGDLAYSVIVVSLQTTLLVRKECGGDQEVESVIHLSVHFLLPPNVYLCTPCAFLTMQRMRTLLRP